MKGDGIQHRIAIIGVGAIAGMHARAIGDLAGVELVAGSCRTESKGRQFSEQHGCRWYDDSVTMLEKEAPDVVTICTPSGAHLEPLRACAQRGIHVLCEKPLEITTSRVDEMIQLAQEGEVVLGGIFPSRFNPVVAAVHNATAAGRFGLVAAVSSYVPWWRDDAYYAPQRWQGTMALDGGGAMMNQSIHGVDMLQWIASSRGENPVTEVFAFTAQRGHNQELIEVEDTAVAVMRFADGSLGQLLGATSMYPGSLKRFQIAGRDGMAEILEDELITWQFRTEQETDEEIRARFSTATKTGGGASDPMAIDYSNHTRNIGAFLDALDGRSELMLDGTEARKSVSIVEAIYESAQSGRVVAPR